MDVHDPRRRSRPRVRRHRIRHGRFLWRGSQGEEPLRELTPRARCEHRKARVVPTARAPRHLGLGSASRADPDRRYEERPADTCRRADDQDEHFVHLRSTQRRAGVRAGRASGAADRLARRGDVAHAALPAAAAPLVAHDLRSCDRSVRADTRAREVPAAISGTTTGCSRVGCSHRRRSIERW